MTFSDLEPGILSLFVEAQGTVQRSRLTAWESKRRRQRPTKGEVMVLSIARKAQALGAVATALDGLKPEDALEVLTLLPTMTAEKLGALASLTKDFSDTAADDLASIVAMAEESIVAVLPEPEHKVRPPRAPARPTSGPGRPMGADSEERVAFVNARGAVTLAEFATHFEIKKDTACHWLKSAVMRRGWIAKGRREEYISLAEAKRREKMAGAGGTASGGGGS